MSLHLSLLFGLCCFFQIVVSTKQSLYVDTHSTGASRMKTDKQYLVLQDMENDARKMQSKRSIEMLKKNVGDDDSTHFETDDITIDDDTANSKAPGSALQVYSSDAYVFLSAQIQPLTVLGAGFSSDLFLDLHPPLQVDVDYTLTVNSTTTATLTLLPGKLWRTKPGQLVARGAHIAGHYHKLGKKGQRLVTVLADLIKQPAARAPHLHLRSVSSQAEKAITGLVSSPH